MKAKKVFGVVVAVGVLGFAGYSIYKYVKTKKENENAITLDEARSDVEEYRNSQLDEEAEEFGEMREEIREHADFNRSYMLYNGEEEAVEEDEDLDEDSEIIDDGSPDVVKHGAVFEEGNELKHEPSSDEARKQFIDMELSDFNRRDEAGRILRVLFNFPFEPKNDGDSDLKNKLIDYRVRFFGFNSKWVKDVSYADLILHYARLAQYNYDGTIKHWVDTFLRCVPLDEHMGEKNMRDMLDQLNNHTFYNYGTDTYGLFNLEKESMNSALNIASRNIDTSLTYDIEFNEFLKTL